MSIDVYRVNGFWCVDYTRRDGAMFCAWGASILSVIFSAFRAWRYSKHG